MLKDDLIEGQNAENEVADFYRKKGFTVTTTQCYDQYSSHDLLMISPVGKQYKVEVKYDRRVNETGNVAVELYKIINSLKLKSGLSITESDYYIYKLGNDFFMIKTDKLKMLIKEKKKSINFCMGGDNMSVYIALIPKFIFKKYTKKLNINE